ncbi:MAG: acetyl-lysine deacetylase [Candidatus Tectimicrobiota bacterium]|nr:MAG: acetyl-lysine deacetylase [Candidatus Tectomicrobia bacterium]
MTHPDIVLLEELVAIYSPSQQESAASEYLVAAMRQRGFDQAFVDEAGNAVGVWGHGTRDLLLVGHLDTVPGQIPVRREGDLLYGRGSVDAKGPLACFVAAVSRLEKPHAWRLVVVGAVEEEAATSKGARFLRDRYRPCALIIGEPSQWDSITLGYKGRLLLDYTLRQPMAHSAGPQPSAPEVAVAFWNALQGYAQAYNRERGTFDTLDASLRAMHSESDGLHETATLRIGMRVPLGFDVAALKQWLQQQAGAAALRFYGQEVAYRADKRTPLVRAFLKAIREQGGTPRFKVKTGTSDMNVLAPHWQCPAVAYGPGDSALDHTPHEHLDLREYLRAIAVLSRALALLIAAPA